jgi:hypothetical protein
MELRTQLNKLEEAILNNVQTQFPNRLAEDERALVSAYLVLAHAVLEEELEEAFLAAFDELAVSLSQPIVPIQTVQFVFALTRWLPTDLLNSRGSSNLHGFVSQGCRQRFLIELNRNHGLKAVNIKGLAKLIGLDWDALENAHSDRLADLNTLGSKRGAAGHLSPFSPKTTGLTEDIDPDDVRLWVQYGLDAVDEIKRVLNQLATPRT